MQKRLSLCSWQLVEYSLRLAVGFIAGWLTNHLKKTIILRSVQNFYIHPLMHGSNCIRDFASDVSIRQIYFGTWCYLCYMKEPSMPLWQDAAAELEARASSSSTSSIPISQPSLLPPPSSVLLFHLRWTIRLLWSCWVRNLTNLNPFNSSLATLHSHAHFQLRLVSL